MELQDFIDALKDGSPTIRIDHNFSFYEAYYNKKDDYILINNMSRHNKIMLFFHELCHSSGHKSRLHRQTIVSPVGLMDVHREEMIAQLSADALLTYFNLNNEELKQTTKRYLSQFTNCEYTINSIKFHEVPKIVNFILNEMLDLNKLTELKKVA